MAKNAVITGWGFYAPSRVVTNFDLAKFVDTTDEWISSRTGIKERRFASDGENTSSMSVRAARMALDRAKLRPQDVQMVIVGTCSPDYLFPATACIVQSEIGATRAGAFDVEAACTSFVTALGVAKGLISAGTVQNVLVIGAETLSRLLNFKDRTTCVLFGDGAGAVVVEASNASVGVESVVLHSEGSKGDLLMVKAGASRVPATKETVEQGQHFITMQGGEVFKLAVKSMADAAEEALREAGLGLDDIAIMIPHQANLRIIDGVAKRLHFPMEKVFVNIQRYGNTSAASIPIAIAEAAHQGRLRRGDKVLLVAFGGGFTWGASVLEWFGAHDGMRPPSVLERARGTFEDVVDRVRPI
ncbi:MAG: ketoacyl-ACP synthase III [Chloroflexi bacterium]|nr:MAG: ketoacyl-ACP synthase III [Chloroflexota bacterium]TMC30238.1 MAG: ketoacyl-ACP synthase III [Chloroflexota bacterium]TMC33382.1 MAG: ketoacyl-ACP synthase III [Chloroflexota bacterium]TME43402.1 MAG: ketoacyl-ACP synthase III [Chloroflexota bacterium]